MTGLTRVGSVLADVMGLKLVGGNGISGKRLTYLAEHDGEHDGAHARGVRVG
jgi:hypothetical protein